jgi:hypothetical protein
MLLGQLSALAALLDNQQAANPPKNLVATASVRSGTTMTIFPVQHCRSKLHATLLLVVVLAPVLGNIWYEKSR